MKQCNSHHTIGVSTVRCVLPGHPLAADGSSVFSYHVGPVESCGMRRVWRTQDPGESLGKPDDDERCSDA